jgi:hypothetical protein
MSLLLLFPTPQPPSPPNSPPPPFPCDTHPYTIMIFNTNGSSQSSTASKTTRAASRNLHTIPDPRPPLLDSFFASSLQLLQPLPPFLPLHLSSMSTPPDFDALLYAQRLHVYGAVGGLAPAAVLEQAFGNFRSSSGASVSMLAAAPIPLSSSSCNSLASHTAGNAG